jgi:2-aminoadipate transaminase
MLRVKAHHDFGTANLNQAIIEQILGAGEWEPHLRRVRAHYGRKAAVLDAALAEGGLRELGWTWTAPGGGLLFWLHAPEGVDTSSGGAFCASCLEREVLYVPGELCFAEGAPCNKVRLSIGTLDEAGLREAALRFCAAAASMVPA